MDVLPEPTAGSPRLFDAPAPLADLLPWSWAEERLKRAREYWIATVRVDGRPHCRPVWGVWLPDGFWFSTGSSARENLVHNPNITVHSGDGQEVVILEGVAGRVDDAASLTALCQAYTPKYDYPISPVDGEVRDPSGTGGPAYRALPHKVIAWGRDMANPTRWTFAH